MIPLRDWPGMVQYLVVVYKSRYALANELNHRSEYRKDHPASYQQIERYENGTIPICYDATAIEQMYQEEAPEEIRQSA